MKIVLGSLASRRRNDVARDSLGIGDFVSAQLVECASEILEARLEEVTKSQDAVPPRLVHVDCGGFVTNGICIVCNKIVN